MRPIGKKGEAPYFPDMPKPVRFPRKRLLLLDEGLVERIRDFRFSRRFNTEAEAMRALLEIGLEHAPAVPGSTSGAGGAAKPPKAEMKPKGRAQIIGGGVKPKD